MIAYAIVVKDNDVSEKGFERLVKSSKDVGNKFEIKRFDAITPDNVKEQFAKTYSKQINLGLFKILLRYFKKFITMIWIMTIQILIWMNSKIVL